MTKKRNPPQNYEVHKTKAVNTNYRNPQNPHDKIEIHEVHRNPQKTNIIFEMQ